MCPDSDSKPVAAEPKAACRVATEGEDGKTERGSRIGKADYFAGSGGLEAGGPLRTGNWKLSTTFCYTLSPKGG